MKDKIKEYWERHPTQVWYSSLEPGSLEYFEEIERMRYSIHYPYLKEVAEFDKHKGEKVLEIGCGPGTVSVQYAKGGASVTAIDLAEEAINLTRKQFELRNLDGTFLVHDAESLPFESGEFDLIYSFGVLHHTPGTQQAISEIYRVLRPGGKAIVMLYHKWSCAYLSLIFRRGILGGELLRMPLGMLISKYTELHTSNPLTKVFSRAEAKKMFKKEFNSLEIKTFVPTPRYREYQTPRFLTSLEAFWGWNMVIKAIK